MSEKKHKGRRQKTLIEQGFHVYQGTGMVMGNKQPELPALPRSSIIVSPSHLYHLFGDESTAKDIVTYGIVLLNDVDAPAAEEHFSRVVLEAGVPPGTRFHCREVFNDWARAKGPWKNKCDYEMWDIAKALLKSLTEHCVVFCVGAVDMKSYPEEMPDGPSRLIRLSPAHLYPMAFRAAISC